MDRRGRGVGGGLLLREFAELWAGEAFDRRAAGVEPKPFAEPCIQLFAFGVGAKEESGIA